MLVKAGIAGVAVVCAMVSLSRVDYRELYNEMYPVNGLRRDVLNLCHQAEPTFVRAIESNRVYCYDSMPDPVELAIGWVRTSSRLAAMRRPTPVEVAEKLLISSLTEHRIERLAEPRFTGYATVPGGAAQACDDATPPLLTSSNGQPSRGFAAAEAAPFAALGLPPKLARANASSDGELPVLSLGGDGDSGLSNPRQGLAGASLDAPVASDLGGDAASLTPPRIAGAACRAPA